MNSISYIGHSLFFSSFTLSIAQALALTSDHYKPIYINSMQQIIDLGTNDATLIGNVIIKRGSINIHADKVTITHQKGKYNNKIVEGCGAPITFYQLRNDGNPIYGHSQKVRYETMNDLIILIGNAQLQQLDSCIKGDRINYFMKKQHMEAFSYKGNQVITILMPTNIKNRK